MLFWPRKSKRIHPWTSLGLRGFFWGKLLLTNSISWLDTGLFRFSVSSSVNFDTLYFSRKSSISCHSKFFNISFFIVASYESFNIYTICGDKPFINDDIGDLCSHSFVLNLLDSGFVRFVDHLKGAVLTLLIFSTGFLCYDFLLLSVLFTSFYLFYFLIYFLYYLLPSTWVFLFPSWYHLGLMNYLKVCLIPGIWGFPNYPIGINF